jgi:hypothetical protein
MGFDLEGFGGGDGAVFVADLRRLADEERVWRGWGERVKGVEGEVSVVKRLEMEGHGGRGCCKGKASRSHKDFQAHIRIQQ